MDEVTVMFMGVLFGGIGFGFFFYGIKQKALVPLTTGMLIFILPYLAPNLNVLLTLGSLLIIAPYFLRI